MKVLIVDDEVTIHRQLEQCLDWAQYGWEIVGHAYNGEEACQIVEQQQAGCDFDRYSDAA